MSFRYCSIQNHSWMDSADVEYHLDKIRAREREILKELEELAPEVDKFDYGFALMSRKQDRLYNLKSQVGDIVEKLGQTRNSHEESRLLGLLDPLETQIRGLESGIRFYQNSLAIGPKDRSNALQQELEKLRTERERLRTHRPD